MVDSIGEPMVSVDIEVIPRGEICRKMRVY